MEIDGTGCFGVRNDVGLTPLNRDTRKALEAMKFVLASYGTRGDIEPSVVVARELQRRGHDVVMAVPPDLISFTESAGLRRFPTGWTPRRGWTCIAISGRSSFTLSGRCGRFERCGVRCGSLVMSAGRR